MELAIDYEVATGHFLPLTQSGLEAAGYAPGPNNGRWGVAANDFVIRCQRAAAGEGSS